jgi:hypothetical protein
MNQHMRRACPADLELGSTLVAEFDTTAVHQQLNSPRAELGDSRDGL